MKRFTFFVLAALLVAGAAYAQEQTGTIEGIVADNTGQALPGVTVEITGANIGTRAAVTDLEGTFRFPLLPSAVYKLKAALAGFTTVESGSVDLTVGKTVKVNFTMQPGTFEEAMTVAADAVVIDFGSAATADNIRREQIEFIPRGRDFTSVISQVAGAEDTARGGGISIDGSSGLENRYIIDGIDTTDPQTGAQSVPMRADFFEEVQVKSAGYAAEFGGATGGVINAITKSGRNDFQGGLLFEYQNVDLNGDTRPTLRSNLFDSNQAEYETYDKDDNERMDPGFFLSGPIFKDRLWFFASYQPGITSIDRTVTFVNTANPDGFYTDTYTQDQQVDYAAFNLSANLGPVLLKAGGNTSDWSRERDLPPLSGRTTQTSQGAYVRGREGERQTYSLTADWVASDSFVVSARAGLYHTDYTDTGVNFPGLIHNYSTAGANPGVAFPTIPDQFKQVPGFTTDTLITDATARNLYERELYGADASWFFNAAGDHTLKFGYQLEKISNDVQSGYNADRILYYWDRSYTTTTGQKVRGTYGYFRLLNISTLGEVQTDNEAIFLQDSWVIGKNFTLNIGVRSEHERVPNFGNVGPDPAIEFDWSDKIAPRVGFAWDITGDQKWKVYGSYGTYYDTTKYEMPRGSFGGDKWVDYFYTFDNYDYTLNGAGCTVGSNTTDERPTCGAGSLIEVVDRRHNSADPNESYIDPDLAPMETWEAQLGVDHQFTNDIVIGARYVHKQLVKTIEDIGILVPGIGEVYYIGNPGYGLSTSIAEKPFPKAEREYDALELTFNKRFNGRWSLNAAYTYSKLWGNYSGLANSDEYNTLGGGGRLSPNVSRLFDTIQNMFDVNGDLVYGRLATDRPHQFKAQVMYRFPFNLTVGVNQYVGSGTPISEEATVPISTPFLPYGRGSLGRTPTLTQTDLSLFQDFKLLGLDWQFGVTVLNLWDEDTVVQRWPSRVNSDLAI
ncbi:MAG: TonB-dependent receptor, partial [Acidobacteriota bacterium]